jgi:hypothetical protein
MAFVHLYSMASDERLGSTHITVSKRADPRTADKVMLPWWSAVHSHVCHVHHTIIKTGKEAPLLLQTNKQTNIQHAS